jgi:hypothetical protein
MQALAAENIPLKFKSYLSTKLTDRTGSWSIVARLALLYTVLSTVVLCAAGFFLYWTLVQSLRSEEQSILADPARASPGSQCIGGRNRMGKYGSPASSILCPPDPQRENHR